MVRHIVYVGDLADYSELVRFALLEHYPDYEADSKNRTRISVLVSDLKAVHDLVFEYQELFDNSYWRIVDLTSEKPKVELNRPQYEGLRKDFVDIEWEFILGHLSHPVLQEKLRRWANDPNQQLVIYCAYPDNEKNRSIVEKFKRRLPDSVKIQMRSNPTLSDADANVNVNFNVITNGCGMDDNEILQMSKYLHFCYLQSYQYGKVPTELPEQEVEKAWNEIEDESMKMANIYNVMSIPVKMEILGHDRNDWDTFYALNSEEIELLTAVDHNRWCVERLIQGMRPCTDQERKEIEQDLQKRLSDNEYAKENPVSLKQKYKKERNAHYDLCAFSELAIDQTGLPVSRYDRDLVSVIPLIVKTYYDRYGKQ